MKVAFLGLGVMGYPMAGHLKKNGMMSPSTIVRAAKAEKWVAEFRRQVGADAARMQPKAKISSLLASAMTMICAP